MKLCFQWFLLDPDHFILIRIPDPVQLLILIHGSECDTDPDPQHCHRNKFALCTVCSSLNCRNHVKNNMVTQQELRKKVSTIVIWFKFDSVRLMKHCCTIPENWSVSNRSEYYHNVHASLYFRLFLRFFFLLIFQHISL